MISYSILIPAYNVEDTLPKLIDQIEKISHPPSKIFVVDDGSQDQTMSLVRDKAAHVELIHLDKNRGKGFALRTGFKKFISTNNGDYLLCMDADLQHPVSHIGNFLIAAAHNQGSLIIGKRRKSLRLMPLPRIISNSISSFILSLVCKQKIEDSQCGFRIIRNDLLRELHLQEDGFQLESEMIIEAAQKNISILFIGIPTIYNGHPSHINHWIDTWRFIRLIIKALFKAK